MGLIHWFWISEAEGKTWPAGVLKWHRCSGCGRGEPGIITGLWSIRLCLKRAHRETALYGKLIVKLEKLSGPLLLSWGSDALKEQHLLLASPPWAAQSWHAAFWSHSNWNCMSLSSDLMALSPHLSSLLLPSPFLPLIYHYACSFLWKPFISWASKPVSAPLDEG